MKVCEQIHNCFNIFNIHFHPSELPSVKYLVMQIWPEALNNVWYIACQWYLMNVDKVNWDCHLARCQELVTYLFKDIYCWYTTEMSFLLFHWPLYLGLLFFIGCLYIHTCTDLVTQASLCLLFASTLRKVWYISAILYRCWSGIVESENTEVEVWLLNHRKTNATLHYRF